MTKQKHSNRTQKSTEKKAQAKKNHQTKSLGNDYWDRIADDVASGYEGKDDTNEILNTDQEADDHIRGDDEPAA